MRRLSLVFLVLLACGKSPTAAPPKPGGNDPYAIVGASFAPGLFPDLSFVTTTIRYSGTHPTESGPNRYINIVTAGCTELYSGSGFVDDNIITVEWVVTDTLPRDSTQHPVIDTLARYVSAPLDPLNSPIPGWGDTPDHMVRWSLRIDSLTPKAPLTATFLPSTMPGYSWVTGVIPQAAYCAQP